MKVRNTKKQLKDAVIPAPAPAPPQMEICVSFSRKWNLSNYGGPAYESIDFFVSRKQAGPEEAAPIIADALRQACVEDVEAAGSHYLTEAKRNSWKSQTRKSQTAGGE